MLILACCSLGLPRRVLPPWCSVKVEPEQGFLQLGALLSLCLKLFLSRPFFPLSRFPLFCILCPVYLFLTLPACFLSLCFLSLLANIHPFFSPSILAAFLSFSLSVFTNLFQLFLIFFIYFLIFLCSYTPLLIFCCVLSSTLLTTFIPTILVCFYLFSSSFIQHFDSFSSFPSTTPSFIP